MSNSLRSAAHAAHELDMVSHSPAQSDRFGRRIGALLQPGDLLLLSGPLGAGKTHLTKGIARGLGSEDPVTSPTFVLVNEYRADADHQLMPIYHADLYRLSGGAELSTVGLDELWNGDGVCIVEWAERAEGVLPAEHLLIQIDHLSETKRTLRLVPHGDRYRELVAALKASAFR